MKVLYSWLKDYVGDEMPDIKTLEELFTFHAFEIDGVEEVDGDYVIDVKVLPDRGADCLSHRGIAHELATLIGKPLVHDSLRESCTLEPKTSQISITIENTNACSYFGIALMHGVSVTESPEWLRKRLIALGQRSINNVVDATNYVMLALGQPLHAYDAAKIVHDDTWQFNVRMAREGETITTLSGEVCTLDPTMQLIVDGATDTPLSIAGVKGGKHAEIDAQTTSIILESANFNPQITRKAAQKLKLPTDAAKRFENGIVPHMAPIALHEVVALITKVAGGECAGFSKSELPERPQTRVIVSHTRIQEIIGITVDATEIESIFSRLGFSYTKNDDAWEVAAPFERTDITMPEDVIAEIARIHGYEHINAIPPEKRPTTELSARHYYSEKIRAALTEEGFSEIITSSFCKKDAIELQNALASDKKFLRSSLRKNILEALDRNMPNADLLGVPCIELFEIGTVFEKTPDGTDVTEHTSLAIGVRTKQQGYVPRDDERLREIATRIGEKLGISLEARIENGILECNLTEIIATLPQPTTYDATLRSSDSRFMPYSAYPFVSRDIALWVPQGTNASNIESSIRSVAGELLVRISLFDEFSKDGRTSYAFRLIFQSMTRTLTDTETNNIMEKISTEMQSRGFDVR